MKDTTVAIWVRKSDFKYFLEVFRTLTELPESHFSYSFRSEDIRWFNEKTTSECIQMNIPVLSYLKWEVCYSDNLNKINSKTDFKNYLENILKERAAHAKPQE